MSLNNKKKSNLCQCIKTETSQSSFMQIIQTKAIQDAFPSKSVLSAGVCSTMNDLMPMVRCVVRTVQHSVVPCKYSVLSNFSTSCSLAPWNWNEISVTTWSSHLCLQFSWRCPYQLRLRPSPSLLNGVPATFWWCYRQHASRRGCCSPHDEQRWVTAECSTLS